MRRERTLLMVIALFAVAAFFTVAPAALADGGTPADICADIQDGHLDGTYSAAQITAFNQDPTVQGYCGPIIVVVTPPPACVEVAPGTTPPAGTTACVHPCVEVAPGQTPPAGSSACAHPCVTVMPGQTPPAGSTACTTPPTPPTTPPTPPVTPSAVSPVVITGVKGIRHTVVTPVAKPTAAVAGAQHTVKTPVASAVAPIATTRTSGTLPFTGAQLALFTLVGLALVASGLLLRTTSRQSRQQ